jgi:hypothetical protein
LFYTHDARFPAHGQRTDDPVMQYSLLGSPGQFTRNTKNTERSGWIVGPFDRTTKQRATDAQELFRRADSETVMGSQMRRMIHQIDPTRTDQTSKAITTIALERHYSVGELATLWSFSENTVRRIFIKEPGVLKVAHKETRSKRRYTTLRIPERIAQRVHLRLQGFV